MTSAPEDLICAAVDNAEEVRCNVAPSAGPYPAEISQGPSGPI
jgi:hypothetical protein